VIPLIEEQQGVENIEEIAAVPNIGGIFFGPFDLAVSKGAGGDAHDADVAAERARVYAAAAARRLPVLDLAWDPEAALALFRQGADAVAVNVDVTIFASSIRDLAAGCTDAKRRVRAARRRAAAPSRNGRGG
jgi:2-keto-3-deoxy-L-rhamnonate aldolase RhmA